jgi:hypothetical protein
MRTLLPVVAVAFLAACGGAIDESRSGEPSESHESTGAPRPALGAPSAQLEDLPPEIAVVIHKPNTVAVKSYADHLGRGYAHEMKGRCVDGPRQIEIRTDASFFPAQGNVSANKLAGWLAADTVDLTVGTRKEEELVRFVTEANADESSLSLIVPVVLQAGALSLDTGAQKRTAETDCGDRWIAGATLGARLAYGLKFHFRDPPAKQAFVARYGDDVAKIMARNDLRWVAAAIHGKASIQVQMFQLGGDPEKAWRIAHASRCSIGDMAACNAYMADMEKYARGTLLEDLKTLPTAEDRGLWAFTHYHALVYRD